MAWPDPGRIQPSTLWRPGADMGDGIANRVSSAQVLIVSAADCDGYLCDDLRTAMAGAFLQSHVWPDKLSTLVGNYDGDVFPHPEVLQAFSVVVPGRSIDSAVVSGDDLVFRDSALDRQQ